MSGNTAFETEWNRCEVEKRYLFLFHSLFLSQLHNCVKSSLSLGIVAVVNKSSSSSHSCVVLLLQPEPLATGRAFRDIACIDTKHRTADVKYSNFFVFFCGLHYGRNSWSRIPKQKENIVRFWNNFLFFIENRVSAAAGGGREQNEHLLLF